MPDLDPFDAEYRYSKGPGDERIAALADRQNGVVAHRQLIALGYSASQIQRRVVAGRLYRVHRGVYAVGRRRISRKGRWMAAVLASGPDAVLSHRSAASLWALPCTEGGKVDVTAPRGRKRQNGIAVHNVRHLHPADCTTIDNIPVTSIHRTLLDLAEVVHPQRLRTAVEAAERQDLFDLKAIEELLARSPGRRGVKPLRRLLDELRGPAPETRSELERRFLELIRAAGLPEPSVNVVVAGETVDFYWPRQTLVVELDGYKFHKSRRSF